MKKFLLIFGLLFLTSVLYSQWEPINKNLFGGDIISLASNDSCLFAGTTGQGIIVSTDKGNSWSQSGLDFSSVTSIQINGKNIYAATIDAGIFLSTYNGRTWVAKNNGLTNLKVLSIAFLWKKIIIGTKGDGIFI
ncbi:MAG: WD40/YVTN/BNR-like repeat-containing protein [Candidatus Kapaibacteriota bacterium]